MTIERDDDSFFQEMKKEAQNEKKWAWYALSVRKRQALRATILHEGWFDEWGEEPLDEEDPDYPTLTDLVKAKEYLKELNICYDGWGNKYYTIKGRTYLDADGRIPIDLQMKNNEQVKLQLEQQRKERVFELEKQILGKLKLIAIEGTLIYKYIRPYNRYLYLSDAMLYVEIRRCLEIDLQPATLKKLADLIKSNPDIQHKADEFNSNPLQLNCKNGVLDFSKGIIEVLPHDSETLFSYCIDAEFLPQPERADVWDTYCQTTFPEETELHQQLLEEFMGAIYCDTMRCKCMFVGVGLPNTGKSVLAEHISRSCGLDNISNMDPKELASEFGRMQLYGKKANVITELSAKNFPDSATLKKLTSGDLVTGAYKGKDAISFHNSAKIVFFTNVLPTPAELDLTDAFMNRIVPLIFSHKIPDSARDPELQKKLWACRDVIFTRSMHALLRLFSNNFEFTKPRSSREFLENYKAQLNSFAVFFNRCVELVDSEEYIFATDMLDQYHNFCEAEGWETLNNNEVRRFLDAKKEIEKTKKRRNGKGNPISCYVGCRFKNLEKDLAVLRVI